MTDSGALLLAEQTRVCIAIPTFRRPEQLAVLLDAIALQAFSSAYSVGVVVIDNDSRPSARDVVNSYQSILPFPLAYAHHPQPGLSSVRNFALTYAHDFSFLAMMDDDQVPEPQWLAELLRVQRTTDSDAVIGTVSGKLPDDAPRWLRGGGFYENPMFPDGASITFGNSGNCLLRVASLERFGLRFDAGLNFAGGEDFLFFLQLTGRGGLMTFACNAKAFEWLPAERLRARFLIERAFRRGNTLAMCDRRLGAGLPMRGVKGAIRAWLGLTALVPRALVRGRAGAVAALCDVAHGFGALAGVAGHLHLAYRRDDASC